MIREAIRHPLRMQAVFRLHLRNRGLSLLEVVVSMLILLLVGLATIAAIIFTRQSMELDKQRLAAINYCRQAMEAAGAHATISSGETLLVPFNTPGVEDLKSNLEISFYDIKNGGGTNGQIDWTHRLDVAPLDRPVLCRAQVTWVPPGSWGKRQQKVSMYSIVRAGTL